MSTQLRLRTKLIVLIGGLTLVPFVVLGVYANRVATITLADDAARGMSTVRDAAAARVQDYFAVVTDFAGDLGYHRTLVQALQRFGDAFRGGAGGPAYTAAAQEFGEPLRHLADSLRVSRFYLIDPAGNVLFNGAKRADVGTNLLDGPYRQSVLAEVFRRAQDKPATVDVQWYDAADDAVAFVAGPVRDAGGALLGVVATEIGSAAIDALLGSPRDGNGGGALYLVGPDFVARTTGSAPSPGAKAGSRAPREKVETAAVRDALAGRSGTWTGVNHVGRSVMSAYRPVDVLGSRWALVAETGEQEAMAALGALRGSIWFVSVVILAVVLGVGWFVTGAIGSPIQSVIAALSTTTTQIAATVDEHERTAAQQATAVNQTSSTMTELDATARQASAQAESAAEAAARALTAAGDGQRAVAESLREMDNVREKVQAIAQQILCLSEQTGQIESITRLVGNLASQTNLLALNAAVEAARAGEHGKGFAVVAGEIRQLADESKRSAERISALVSDIQDATNSTVMATEEGMKMVEQGSVMAQRAAGGFGAIIETAASASENAQQITLNVRQQAAAISQVVEAMTTLNDSSRETVAGLTQTRAGIQNLQQAAQSLAVMV